MNEFITYLKTKIGEESCPIQEINRVINWAEIRLKDNSLLILTKWENVEEI